MIHIFYFLTIFAILWELYVLNNSKRVHAFVQETKNEPSKEWDDYSSTRKTFTLCSIGYLFWNFIGLVTFQWPLYLTVLLLGQVPKRWAFIRWADSAICLVLWFFSILNAYHLHIDLWHEFLKLLPQ